MEKRYGHIPHGQPVKSNGRVADEIQYVLERDESEPRETVALV